MVSLAVRWQAFHWQHLIGFAVLILGMAQYNGLLPALSRRPQPDAEAEPESEVVNTAADADA